MALGVDKIIPELNFSWLGNLPSVSREAQSELGIKEAMQGLDINTASPESLERISSTLLRVGHPNAIKLGVSIADIANKRREAAAATHLGGVGARFLTGDTGGDAGKAISGIESGGRYDAQGPLITRTGDRAYGKYQVMGANVGPWSREVLGKELTPEQFLSDPDAQEKVFKAKFGQYQQKYGPEGAARAWFAGEGGMNDLGRKDQLGTTVGQYGQKFAQAFGAGAREEGDPTLSEAASAGAAYRRKSETIPRDAAIAGALAGQRLMPKEMSDSLQNVQKEKLSRQSIELKEDAENFRKFETDVNKKAEAAIVTRKTADVMKALMDDRGGLVTGALAPSMATIGSAAVSIKQMFDKAGVPLPEWEVFRSSQGQVAKMEAFRALANKLVLAQLGGSLGNQISNADRSFIELANMSLRNTPGANKILYEMTKAVADRDIEAQKYVAKYRKEGGRDQTEISEILTRHGERKALFRDEKTGELTELGKKVQSTIDKEGGGATAPAPAQAPARTPPRAAIEALRADPKRAQEFDAFYGPGSSTRALGGI